jgi:hypothetical protein
MPPPAHTGIDVLVATTVQEVADGMATGDIGQVVLAGMT